MKRIQLVFLALFCAFSVAQAQRVCGSTEHLQNQLQNNPALQLHMEAIEKFTEQYIANNPSQAGERAVITIPVVWHVVWNVNTPSQNISDAQIASQMTVLNESVPTEPIEMRWPDRWASRSEYWRSALQGRHPDRHLPERCSLHSLICPSRTWRRSARRFASRA